MELKGKPTPKNVETSYSSLGKILGFVTSTGILGGLACALGVLAYKLISEEEDDEPVVKETGPIINFAKKLLR